MISFHPHTGRSAAAYAAGFLTVDTNAPNRVASGARWFVWSPIIWAHGVRRRENFLRADWAVLDFDSGEMTLAEAVNTWCDHIHIIGTTKSHAVAKGETPACDRFRVALLLEAPVLQLADYEHTMRVLTQRYPADPSAKDGARFFYPCKEIVSTSCEGYAHEPLRAPPPPDFTAQRRQLARYGTAGMLPGWARALARFGAPVGERHKACYRLGAQLIHAGMDEDAIISLVMSGPLSAIGLSDVERAVRNGAARGRAEGEISRDQNGQTPP